MSDSALTAELVQWLDSRSPQSPAALREKMMQVLAGITAPSITSALGEGAIAALAAAVERCDERAAAMDLLAADALMTYAMEAAAEQGSEAVEAVALAYANHRLATLVSGVH